MNYDDTLLIRGIKRFNSEEEYYKLRNKFNETTDVYKRAVLFVYLNRHGYNGLCRYNLKGGYKWK